MKKLIPLILIGVLLLMCDKATDNPFYSEWQTPYGIPDFSVINDDYYMPAIKDGIKEQLADIEKIANNPGEPTFENTLEAMEKSGKLLDRVTYVFYNLVSANTNDTLQAIQKESSPLISSMRDDINLNPELFARIKKLYNNMDQLNLSDEQKKVLDNRYKSMVRGGANLDDSNKEEFRKINDELSVVTVQFSANVLKDDNAFEMILDNEKDLSGLTDGIISAAAEAAKEKGYEGKWLFTLHKPSFEPFVQYAENRELRERIYKAYFNRGDNDNANDNKSIMDKIANLRIRKANLLGYKTHADFILEERMAKNPENVYKLLDQVWPAALNVAKKERDMMQKIADAEGGGFKVQAWDWSYYAEKIRKEKYNLEEDKIKPYLQLENVINGSFILAEKLFGLTFEERKDLPKYHDEVKTYIVKDGKGEMIGVYLSDWFYRSSKRGGAWMNEFRAQSNMGGERVLPIITNVGNFTKPTGETPSLLRLDEVETLFHEFGHALHGLLSNTTYPSVSGTNVPRDFVEFPSQVLENWVLHPEMLKLYAFHYKTGAVMPQELIEKIEKASKFNQGFKVVEYMAAAYLDMAWHTLTEQKTRDVNAFEKTAFNKIGLIPEITSRYRTTNFRHIVGGYSSSYYSYLWSETISADAFEEFKKNGIFDKETAKSYRDNILARGGSLDALQMYIDFKGREAEIGPYLELKGLN